MTFDGPETWTAEETRTIKFNDMLYEQTSETSCDYKSGHIRCDWEGKASQKNIPWVRTDSNEFTFKLDTKEGILQLTGKEFIGGETVIESNLSEFPS